MKTKQLILGFSALLFCTILIVSCRKTQDRDDASEVAQQNAIADIAFLDFAYMSDQVSKGPQYFKTFNGDCTTLSYDTIANTISATINFGTADCLCNDGKKRRGQVLIQYSVDYTSAGAISTVTPTNYYVNGNLIEGIRTATISNNVDVVNIVSSATITPENGSGTITWNSTRERVYTGNTNAPNILAGKSYEETGNSTGTTIRGNTFTIDITQALKIQAGCRWIKAGLITIHADNFKNDATVDYGDGTCDSKAKLKYGKKEVDLNL
ncbi:MAG: hypothetical protein WC044_04590 [Crocinitomicaceae bacterium]